MIGDSTYRSFVNDLRAALDHELPGSPAQFEMSPPHRPADRADLHEKRAYHEAAVLALFYPAKDPTDVARLLLTVRPQGMAKHAGQVAFPGGRREPGEALIDTALRETHEEVAISADSIDVLGALSPLYIPPSNFYVHPFVGALDRFPDMAQTSDEVAALFGVSVEKLIDPSIRQTAPRRIGDQTLEIPFFDLNGEFVWGATAMMMAELAAVLRRVSKRRG